MLKTNQSSAKCTNSSEQCNIKDKITISVAQKVMKYIFVIKPEATSRYE